VANVVNVAISDEAANTTTVPDTLGVAIAAAELAGAALLGAAGAADDVVALGADTDEGAAAAEVAAADDGDDEAFLEELHPARPSATTTVVTMTVVTMDAFRFMNSPRRVKGRRLIGVRY
jgi:hypothetical protein